MDAPLISVLLPFRNPGGFFEDAVSSVLKQEGASFELILINNASDNDSVAFATALSAADHRVRLLEEPSQGIAGALNTGLKHCRGEFIARMDSDDLCLPGRLRKQSQFLRSNPDTGLISGRVRHCSADFQNEGMKAYVEQVNRLIGCNEIFEHRFVESPFAHPSVMYRSELIHRFGGYTTEEIPEDYEMWLRWFSKGVKMQKLTDEVIVWRDHPGRATRVDYRYSRIAFDKVRLHYLSEFLKQSNHKKPIYVWGGGRLSKQKVIQLIEKGVKISGFIDVNPDREIPGYEVIHYQNLPPPGKLFIVSMVSNRGRFAEIDQYLRSKNYKIEIDYLLAG